jgi:hypothetical protein
MQDLLLRTQPQTVTIETQSLQLCDQLLFSVSARQFVLKALKLEPQALVPTVPKMVSVAKTLAKLLASVWHKNTVPMFQLQELEPTTPTLAQLYKKLLGGALAHLLATKKILLRNGRAISHHLTITIQTTEG